MSSAHIFKEAMRLSPPKRAKLAAQLLQSLRNCESAEIDAAWGAEIESRIDAFDGGKTGSVPAKKVLEKLRTRKRR